MALAAGLQACGGGGSSAPGGDTAQLQGVVAVGAPVVGATITLTCSSPLTLAPITSGAAGGWSAAVPLAALPCAAAASGGTVGGAANTQTLHSLVLAAGTVNITPLTDLLVAAAAGTSPEAWFAAVTPQQLAAASQAAADAGAAIGQALQAAGYTLPGGFSPLATAFAAEAGDAYDDLLEAVATAIAAAGSSHAAVLAQWAAAAGSPPALPSAPASPGGGSAGTGDGAALAGGNGATATVDGTAYTRTANAGWLVYPGQSVGVFDAMGGTAAAVDPLQRWSLRNVPAVVGTHACAGATGLNIQLQDGGTTLSTAPSGGSCTVDVLAVTGNTITGRFSGTLINALSGASSTMTGGFFRLAASTGGGGTLAAGEQGASFEMDGTTYRYAQAYDFGFETFQGITVVPADPHSPGSPIGIQIHTVPSAPGTYACGSGAAYRALNVWFYWDGAYLLAGRRQSATSAGPAGSSCSVTVTQVMSPGGTGTFEGTFSGTFVSEDLSKRVTVTNGKFRIVK